MTWPEVFALGWSVAVATMATWSFANPDRYVDAWAKDPRIWTVRRRRRAITWVKTMSVCWVIVAWLAIMLVLTGQLT